MHMGEKIKEVFQGSSLSVSELASQVGTSRENMYSIFKRKSVDTDLLLKISKVLDHDFFFHLIDRNKYETVLSEKDDAVRLAQKEIEYLKKINELLEREIERLKRPNE